MKQFVSMCMCDSVHIHACARIHKYNFDLEYNIYLSALRIYLSSTKANYNIRKLSII